MNPFVQNMRLDILQVNQTYQLIPNSRNNDILNSSSGFTIPMPYFIERVDKTSVFHNPEMIDVLYSNLSSTGRDLFLYITVKIHKNKDQIKLQPSIVCENMHCARGTFYNAVNQLLAAGIIAKCDVKNYWINPLYIFNGNRIDYFKALGEQYINIVTQI